MATITTITTVDIIIERHVDGKTHILLIKRAKWPYKDAWALPGGKVDEVDQSLEDAAIRETREETGITLSKDALSQVCARGDKNRDPRGRYISIVYTATVDASTHVQPGDDACDAQWFPIDALPTMAFDHEEMLRIVK